jgi:hypothetical protein
MNARWLGLLLILFCLALGASCNGQVALGGPQPGTDAGSGVPPGVSPPTGTLARASKVDLLLMIDNSASMGDKQDLLKQAVPDLVGRLLDPLCVDAATGAVYGNSNAGACTQGKPEFAPVKDLHVGIVSSSLGGRGSDVCDGTDPVGLGATRHDDDEAHLLVRTAGGGTLSDSQAPDGVLAFGPGGMTSSKDFKDALQSVVAGVGEFGCGLEAQLEAWYRFLIQPDPYANIVVDTRDVDGRRRQLQGFDGTILRQRRAFLRPDSLVAVVVLTDEDDSTADPLTIGGQGWAYMAKRFPGSIGGGAARGTSTCDRDPTSTDCTTCAFPGHANDANCQMPGDIESTTNQPQPGYYPARDDELNVRFFHMRQRYGVDPQFPIARYVTGLASAKVPNRDGEHAASPSNDPYDPRHDYIGTQNCTNPLFAASLPSGPGEELCNLATGPRSANLVVFAVITGVAPSLLSPTLDDAAWRRIVGRDPSSWDYSGVDAHMLQSIGPRSGLPPPSASDTGDPDNGREWDTQGSDLQYACTFTLPAPKDCADPRFAGACDCTKTGPNPPLCNGAIQVRGKAYPAIRELAVARALGDRAVVASICPSTLDPTQPAYGYRPALRALGDRMSKSLVPNE